MNGILRALFDSLAPLPGEEMLKKKAIESVWDQIDARGPARSGNIPVKGAGIIRSGGMSNLFANIA